MGKLDGTPRRRGHGEGEVWLDLGIGVFVVNLVMKNLISLILSLIFSTGVFAADQFPRGSFEFADLEKAKTLATKDKKDIAFIYTDKNTTCGLCQNAVAAYIAAVRSKTVIVYVNSAAKPSLWSQLPELVSKALIPGECIPKIVVTDASVSKVSGSLNYEEYKADDRKAIRGLKKAMKAE